MKQKIALVVLGLSFAGFAGLASSQEKTGDVTMQVVKYDGLKQAVQKNRGKVVLVDFWGTF